MYKNSSQLVFMLLLVIFYIILFKPLSLQYNVNETCKQSQKVFCIGLGRTATSSLTSALINLGYKTWHCPCLYKSEDITNYVNNFDALTELPFCSKYDFKDLYNMYPDAKYILTIRDENRWLKSTDKYKWLADNMIKWYPGYELFLKNFYNFDFSIKNFNNYNNSVIEFFKDKSDQLLIMNIPKGDGYQKLCTFLGREMIYEDFPNVQEINLQIYLRMKYLFD